MKLLYVYVEAEYVVNEFIVNYLRSKGVDVVLEPIEMTNTTDANWDKFNNTSFQEKHIANEYDFTLWATHSSFPALRNFQSKVVPKLGVIDIEHDLFANDLPEHSLLHKNSLLIVFHERHYKTAKSLLEPSRQITRARWPKLDLEYKTFDLPKIDLWNDAILAGTGIWEGLDLSNIPYFNVFRKVWYKKYIDNWNIYGVESLSNPFTGPAGSKYCADACKFLMTIGSSCYQDALFFDSIPIILPANIIKQEPIDDIVSVVNLSTWNRDGWPGLSPFKAITTDNLAHKINILKNDINRRKEVVDILFSEWFPESYYSQPSAHELIYSFIKESIPNEV